MTSIKDVCRSSSMYSYLYVSCLFSSILLSLGGIRKKRNVEYNDLHIDVILYVYVTVCRFGACILFDLKSSDKSSLINDYECSYSVNHFQSHSLPQSSQKKKIYILKYHPVTYYNSYDFLCNL